MKWITPKKNEKWLYETGYPALTLDAFSLEGVWTPGGEISVAPVSWTQPLSGYSPSPAVSQANAVVPGQAGT